MSEELTSWINNDGTFGELQSAPENIRDVVSKKGFKSVNDIVSAYSNIEKEYTPLRQKLGSIPKDPKEYNVSELDDGLKGLIDDNVLNNFKPLAHELGLSNTQFDKLVKHQLNLAKSGMDAYEEENSKLQQLNQEKLKEAWKDKYDANNKLVNDLLTEYGAGEDDMQKLADPAIKNILFNIAKNMDEGSIPATGDKDTHKDPEQELNDLMKSEALLKRNHSDHSKAQAKFMELNAVIANNRKKAR